MWVGVKVKNIYFYFSLKSKILLWSLINNDALHTPDLHTFPLLPYLPALYIGIGHKSWGAKSSSLYINPRCTGLGSTTLVTVCHFDLTDLTFFVFSIQYVNKKFLHNKISLALWPAGTVYVSLNNAGQLL